jgi:uncharacterized protein (DUF983 family)
MIDFRRAARYLGRGFRLRCPRCGGSPVFRGPFAMHAACARCGLPFQREPGYFVGSMYINYGITVLIMLGAFFGLGRFADLSLTQQIVLGSALGLACPLAFFRHARCLWLSLDHLLDPEEGPGRGRG